MRSENTAAGGALIPGRQRLLSVALLLAPAPWLHDGIVSVFRATPLPTLDFSEEVLIAGPLSLSRHELITRAEFYQQHYNLCRVGLLLFQSSAQIHAQLFPTRIVVFSRVYTVFPVDKYHEAKSRHALETLNIHLESQQRCQNSFNQL